VPIWVQGKFGVGHSGCAVGMTCASPAGALPSNAPIDSSNERLNSGDDLTSPPGAAALVPTTANATASTINTTTIALIKHLASCEVHEGPPALKSKRQTAKRKQQITRQLLAFCSRTSQRKIVCVLPENFILFSGLRAERESLAVGPQNLLPRAFPFVFPNGLVGQLDYWINAGSTPSLHQSDHPLIHSPCA
jgi:hypothetical protein